MMGSISRSLLAAQPSGVEKLSPRWLELVPPESVGMAPEVLEEIDPVIEQTIAIGHTPGAVVAIGRGNKMCFLRGYGHRQFYPEKEQITLDTLFDLASVTKVACTATAMAVVMDEGKVSPDDLITKYLPELGSNGKDRITVQHCFTHTSGIGDYPRKGTREELWKRLCDVKLAFPVGERFDYRDNNTLILGYIVERVSGQNLRDFSIQHIYEPLGMADTMHNPDEARRKRAAATETRDDVWFKGVVNDHRAYSLGGVAGHCGLFSTAPDLAILSALWLGKGTLIARDGGRVRLLSPKTFERMTAPHFVTAGVRGRNWDKRSGSENRPWNMTPSAFGHGGWTGTSVWIDPRLDLFVVVLGNRRHPFGKTPNIYPTAGRVGVLAVNSIRREQDTRFVRNNRQHSAPRPPNVPRAPQSWTGRKVGLILSRGEVDDPNGWPARLKRDGIEIVALYFPDESPAASSQTYQTVPGPVKAHPQTAAPVYALNRDCPRVLPTMLHGAEIIVFGVGLPVDCPEDDAWFVINILGHTLQSAADHRLNFCVIDYPNPLEKTRIEPRDLTDKLKPFGAYYRTARQSGLTLGDLALRISADQLLDLKIEFLSGG